MNTNLLFEQLIAKQNLSVSQMQEIMQACMHGELTEGQITAFLALMRVKGETVEELTTAAKIMMKFAHYIDLGPDLLDIVGTGGDGKNTFNVSTACSIVAAAAGARVAKHGNRSVSSRSGSADLLMQAGIELELNNEQLKNCMAHYGICFLFAPQFHPAMAHVRHARQQLGIRSFFNLLGPLINPAQVKKQVVGVFSPNLLQPIAEVLANLGSERALVISADDGMDEASICAVTHVIEYHQGQFKRWTIDPRHFDCYHSTINDIIVDSPQHSLAIIESVLNGDSGPARDMVLLNTALALYCVNQAQDINDGIRQAAQAIDTGMANDRYEQLKSLNKKNL